MMELHGCIVLIVTATRAFTAQIRDSFPFSLYPPVLAVIVEALFAE
jgi:hypothetical protein